MIKSMTGYGRGETTGEGRKWIVEAKSVNHRFLDISIKLPRGITLLEERIRGEIKKKIARGRIDVYVKIQDEGEQKRQVKLDKELSKAYYSALEEISDILPVMKEIKTMDIANMPEVLGIEEPEEDLDLYWSLLQKSLVNAIQQMVNMREKEGQELYKDLSLKADFIHGSCKHLKEQAPSVVNEYQDKLSKKLKDALSGWEVDDNRLLTEVAIMSDRMSIDEEIVRLESHLKQLKKELLSGESVGRKLDFLIQELNREANTIGSKSSNYDISSLVVNIKTDIEKMREQVQNVE
ncbi:MAG: hypothetical protein APF76_05300 [Desulfitibacter sp. BRH_c19]|nr:MAG: hypothetical protein APF76_05300 [Desulfitibacter sp. BRH_c19]